ncbi:hypothetical protein [Paenibacillus macquariensis]|uniref:Uncharacterized protein n=1 Tax=Paenibacillus macquariensis TaxID=948756 RepID=A0ABY1JXC8_9BACL|nr:hypothetical protein [Paenibacillus macquariensis]MEC0089349.1 hypothetical protein [Paenibacillus macquariensis]SIQ93263.1 hypothetical protein SAMN05421578_105109 [Paenibacillus macquariensis]
MKPLEEEATYQQPKTVLTVSNPVIRIIHNLFHTSHTFESGILKYK